MRAPWVRRNWPPRPRCSWKTTASPRCWWSGRSSEAVARRCRDLGISEVQQGMADKGAAFAALIARLGIPARECACIGDDTLDVSMFRQVGLAIAVADAHPDARRAAHRRTRL